MKTSHINMGFSFFFRWVWELLWEAVAFQSIILSVDRTYNSLGSTGIHSSFWGLPWISKTNCTLTQETAQYSLEIFLSKTVTTSSGTCIINWQESVRLCFLVWIIPWRLWIGYELWNIKKKILGMLIFRKSHLNLASYTPSSQPVIL